MSEDYDIQAMLKNLSTGLAGRLSLIVSVLDRLDRLESGSGVWLSNFKDEEIDEEAHSILLRALRIVSEPGNFNVLNQLSLDDSVTINALVENTGLGRVTLTERLNDLAQVGFAVRLIDTDYAQITMAGAGVLDIMKVISAQITNEYKISESKKKTNRL